jgi:MFS superfamily sulfate permease-like transporter
MNTVAAEVPRGNLAGLKRYAAADMLSGFLVFLIALPLCLGISLASGYPAMAGVFTAIIGGIVSTLISNSELTIKGPAAGLIAIAILCVTDFTHIVREDPAIQAEFQQTVASTDDYRQAGSDKQAEMEAGFYKYRAYRFALGVGVAAAIIQILFGVFRAGILGEFFPTAAVHGMLAAIGIIIAAKQFNIALGVDTPGGTFTQLGMVPHNLANMIVPVALIGVVSLVILFGWSFIPNRRIRMIPPQIVVVVAAVPLALALSVGSGQETTFLGQAYTLTAQRFLVDVPTNFFNAFALPDFHGLLTLTGWNFIIMFALVGSLESLLSAKAIDLIDPYQRRTNHDRDLLAIGVGNLLSACVGGLPMISEIVRSKANIDNGARTRFADLYHSLCLLIFVAAFPWLIRMIPLAALAAMLVYTGYRLASPKEWVATFRIGPDQLAVFASTVVATLATDLLKGMAVGVIVQLLIHFFSYAPVRSLLLGDYSVECIGERHFLIRVRHAAVFTNWIGLKRRIERLPPDADVTIDLAETHLVGHTVMEKFHDLERDFAAQHRKLHLRGLEEHTSYSAHPQAARTKAAVGAAGAPAPANGEVAKVVADALGTAGQRNAMLDYANEENITT